MRKLLHLIMLVTLLVSIPTLKTFAQSEKNIVGKIVNEKGEPLEGVTISVGKFTTTSSKDGDFSIDVPTKSTKIYFTLVGFESKYSEIQPQMSVILKASASTDAAEVVVVGYGTQRKKDLTGAVTAISGKVIAERPVQSFDQALSGAASGVQVSSQSGVVNSAPVFRIRGTNSISLSSYPLIIIDGVMSFTEDYSSTSAANNPLSSINPNDIESIDVLKDAAATAIYGSRAANGVVIVTTKKGKSGKTKVTYDGWIGWNKAMRLPKLLNASEYVTFKNNTVANSASSSIKFTQTNDTNGNPIDTKWYDYVYRTGKSQSNSVSLSGGNDNTKYYFAAGYTRQEGILKGNDFKRINTLFNIDSKVNDYLTVGGRVSFSNELNLAATSSGSLSGSAFNTGGLGRLAFVLPPIIAPYNNDGTYNINGSAIGSAANISGISSLSYYNPVVALDNNYSNSENNHLQSNAYVQLNPIKYITLKSQYGIDYLFIDNNIFWSPLNGDGYSYGGYAWSGYSNYKRWIWTNTGQFDYSIGKHVINALYGNEQNQYHARGYGINNQGVSDQAMDVVQAGYTTTLPANMIITDNYQLSNFGRINYSYDGKYMFSGNLRQDKYSALGVKKGTFWGLSAAWDISKEQFFEKSPLAKIFSQFKLRGGYGKVGNVNGIGSYASYSTFASSLYGGNSTLYYSSVGSPTLKWETSKQTSIGLAWGIFNNIVSGDINYYKNNINGLILAVPQATSTGLPSNPLMNVGAMYNRGWEININSTPIRTKDFSWNTSFNITFNTNKVTALADGLTQVLTNTSSLETVNNTKVGYSLGYLWVVRTGGVDPQTGKRIFINSEGEKVYYTYYASANGGNNYSTTADGTTKYVSSTGGTAITQAADAVMYKPTQPKGYGGWTNSLNYKGLELDLLFTYQFGNYLYYGSNAGLHDMRWWNNSSDVLTDTWTTVGDQGKKYPKAIYGDNVSNGSSFPLDINVFKGDYLKLKNVALSYNFQGEGLRKIKISNVKIYGSAQNLFFITPYPGPDPEVSSNANTASGLGVDRNTIANARTFTLGLNVGF